MRQPSRLRRLRLLRAALWASAAVGLLVALPAWVLPARSYEAPWAWISFIGMCVVDDVVLGPGPASPTPELPKIALLAGIIVFRRHP